MADIDLRNYPQTNTIRTEDQKQTLLVIKSITYNVEFSFVPYNIKITENLSPEWNEQTVIGRMDPISTFKRMGRTMTVNFQARAKREQQIPYLDENELIHTIDHLKKVLYPRYTNNTTNRVMVSPPLFRFRYGNLIVAGENTFDKGVLGYITAFSANPNMEINKIYVDPTNNQVPFYPKVYDINFTFTVLNEELAESSGLGVLNKRYFYNYNTDNHKDEQEAPGLNVSGNANVDNSGKDQETDAAKQQTLNPTTT